MAIGASLAAGARRARRGAVRGLAALAVTSAVTNALLKPAFRRQRPGHSPALVPRPGSFSVPSGHSASAFAFATAASRELPGLAPLLMPLAGGVAWSRVRTGVHHRADVLLGSAIGAGLAFAVTARLERRHWRRRTPVGTVADRLAGTEHVLGVLPLGTSDNFARSLGIPVDPRRAAALLTDGKVATVDLGRFVPSGQRPRHFVHAATVGLNVGFARIATRGDVRERLDRFAYLLAAAYAMRKRPAFCCELRYAGTAETMTLTQLSVINAPVFGGPLQLSVPASNPDDRLLDMLAVEDITPGRMFLSGTSLLLGTRRPVPGIRVWHAPGLHVRADEPLEVTLDGEIRGTLPGDFEVAGEALRVITPLDFDDIDD
jgi:diacylglycerol kinase (ATP)